MFDLVEIVLFILLLTVMFVSGLWLVDVSATTIILHGNLYGMFDRSDNPYFWYHLGFLLSTLSFLVLAGYTSFLYKKIK
jgi:hydrogenase/urease accessory protein HupE